MEELTLLAVAAVLIIVAATLFAQKHGIAAPRPAGAHRLRGCHRDAVVVAAAKNLTRCCHRLRRSGQPA